MKNKFNGNESAKGKGFKVGQSGNPGGRPKGLADFVRKSTKQGLELVKLQLEIMRGELVIEKTYYDKEGEAHTVDETPAIKDRQSAINWLADRGFGKVADVVQNPDGSNLYSDVVLAMAQAKARESRDS